MRSLCFNVVTSLFSNFCYHFVIRFLFHFNLVLASNRQTPFSPDRPSDYTTPDQLVRVDSKTRPPYQTRAKDQTIRPGQQTRSPSDQTKRPDHQIRPTEQRYKPADPLPTSVSLPSAKHAQPN